MESDHIQPSDHLDPDPCRLCVCYCPMSNVHPIFNLQCTMGDKVPLNGTWDAVRAVFLAETYRARATTNVQRHKSLSLKTHTTTHVRRTHAPTPSPRAHHTPITVEYMHAPSHTTTHDSEVVRPRRIPAEQPPPWARSRARGGSGQLTPPVDSCTALVPLHPPERRVGL